MTSSVKSGFSTINRLLGKKSKDDLPVDPHSATGSSGSPSSMFSRSMTHLDTSSQYNKIVPLAAMSNAPFEQTFRITVALPRDQLYVLRVGAKTKLHQVLDMTCTAKQLDRDKYEFRHPSDHSMVFSNEFTIGEVGLNEIRLVPISERGQSNHFSSADLGRMAPGNRNSYAAPLSSHNGNGNGFRNGHKSPNKSQYSSTNSLNSLDSARQLQHQQQQQKSPEQPVAPMRKKRAAPRPPSQNVIPEDPNAVATTIRQMSFHVSSPNLSQNLSLPGDKVTATPQKPQNGGLMRPVSMFQGDGLEPQAYNGSTTDVRPRGISRTSSNASELAPLQIPRRKKAAPAPPPRSRDSVTPLPAPRTITPVPQERFDEKETSENVSKTLLNSDAKTSIQASVQSVEPKHLVVENISPASEVTQVVESPVPIAIVTQNGVVDHLTQSVHPNHGPDPVSNEDEEGHRVNIYNLNSGKCVEAEIVLDNSTNAADDRELILESIQGMILEEEETKDIEKPHVVVEDLYAEVKKPQKKQLETPQTQVENTNQGNEKERRSDSPLWTYTLPAPVHFADGNNNNVSKANGIQERGTAAAPTETFNGHVYYNFSENDTASIAAPSMTTTVVSDVLITPIIKERIPMLEQPLMLPLDDNDHFNNNSESSEFNSSSTLTSAASPNNLHAEEDQEEMRQKLIINSDIEDGYQGPQERMFVNQGLIQTLEKRREKFIENELEQLVNSQSSFYSDDVPVAETLISNYDGSRSKSTAIAAENQEPTISTSPVEDGLSSGRSFLHNSSTIPADDDSGLFNSTAAIGDDQFMSSEESKNVSLETTASDHSAAQNNSSNIISANQSFEQRRSSFLAELENSKNIFNRRTSNELSISDSPSSLQSLQVMRSILMNTKKEEEDEGEQVLSSKVEEELNSESKINNELPPQVLVPEQPPQKPIVVNKPTVLVEPTPWKYTGPPKINLGSWNERPKIQVCLKTDSDYHHSLQKAAAEKKLKEASSVETPEKPPLIRAVELKKTVSLDDKTPVPTVALREAPPIADFTETLAKMKMQRPVTMHSTRFTPTVRGFLSNAKDRDEDSEIRSTKINPVLLRSNSNVLEKANGRIAINKDEEKEKVVVVSDEPISVKSPPATYEKPVIFSQSTLKRTGYKERMLAKTEEPIVVKKETPLRSILVDRPTPKEVVPTLTPPPPPPPMPVKAPGSLLNPLARLSSPSDKVVDVQKPIVRGMVVKRQPIIPDIDPRAALLDSIRNFSFNNSRKM